MELSVVVPTLNGRDRLGRCLDALADHALGAEVIVVNGPSADGTTGMVKGRTDVDALIEISDRNVNVARNAGIVEASGDVIAFVSYDRKVVPSWPTTVEDRLEEGAEAVTGPTRRTLGSGGEVSRSVAGQSVTYCNGENMAFRRDVLEALDGFDEYLTVGGARDISHRLAVMDFDLRWDPSMSVRSSYGADGGRTSPDHCDLYRSLSYQLAKNYGPSPRAGIRAVLDAGEDALETFRAVVRGDADPSGWLANGRDSTEGLAVGFVHGIRARYRDRSARRNPHGLSTRRDRAVRTYDWRDA